MNMPLARSATAELMEEQLDDAPLLAFDGVRGVSVRGGEGAPSRGRPPALLVEGRRLGEGGSWLTIRGCVRRAKGPLAAAGVDCD